nr:RND transporter [Lysinibacillus timonensis]
MKHKDTLKLMNWIVFTSLVIWGVIVAFSSLVSLDRTQMPIDGAFQSRFQFNWYTFHTVMALILVFTTVLLTYGWKRTFPFNVPFALIIAGSLYLFIFLTFTIGWIRILGLLGFAIAIIVGVILIILHTIILWISKE